MPVDELLLFNSVISLTNNRDRRSLGNKLTHLLFQLISAKTITLLQMTTDPSDGINTNFLELTNSCPANSSIDNYTHIPTDNGPTHVVIDSDLLLCIKSESVITSEKVVNRITYPITISNKISALLDIHGYESTASSGQIIEGFIKLFSNFITIIDDNEHDTLTGLLNRKTFDAQLGDLLTSSSEVQIPSIDEERRLEKPDINHWVGILDIDHFKNINDNFGHVYGDEVLLLFANIMKKTFRNNDLLFRYGGEEFVVVLTSTQDSDAFMVFDRFRQQLERYDFPQIGHITASAGIVKVTGSSQPTLVLEHADKALYYAKEHGRNQVANYHQLIETGLIKEQEITSDIELF